MADRCSQRERIRRVLLRSGCHEYDPEGEHDGFVLHDMSEVTRRSVSVPENLKDAFCLEWRCPEQGATFEQFVQQVRCEQVLNAACCTVVPVYAAGDPTDSCIYVWVHEPFEDDDWLPEGSGTLDLPPAPGPSDPPDPPG